MNISKHLKSVTSSYSGGEKSNHRQYTLSDDKKVMADEFLSFVRDFALETSPQPKSTEFNGTLVVLTPVESGVEVKFGDLPTEVVVPEDLQEWAKVKVGEELPLTRLADLISPVLDYKQVISVISDKVNQGLVSKVSPGIYKSTDGIYHSVKDRFGRVWISSDSSLQKLPDADFSYYPQPDFLKKFSSLVSSGYLSDSLQRHPQNIRDYKISAENYPNLYCQSALLQIVREKAEKAGLKPWDLMWGVTEKHELVLLCNGEAVAKPVVQNSDSEPLTFELLGSDHEVDPKLYLPSFKKSGKTKKLSDCIDSIVSGCEKAIEGESVRISAAGSLIDITETPQGLVILVNGVSGAVAPINQQNLSEVDPFVNNLFQSPLVDSKKSKVERFSLLKLRVRDDYENLVVQSRLDMTRLLSLLYKAIAQELLAAQQYLSNYGLMIGRERNAINEFFRVTATDEWGHHAFLLQERIAQLGGNSSCYANPRNWDSVAESAFVEVSFPYDVEVCLGNAIANELIAINTYQEIYDYVKDDDLVTADMVTEIMKDEQEHLKALQDFLNDISFQTQNN